MRAVPNIQMRQACARTNTGNVRVKNEDFFLTDPENGIYLLADGMGGARGGERASRLAVETVAAELLGKANRDASSLLEAVELANSRVLAEARSNPKLEGMGTTLVAAVDLGDTFAIASVGDSRAYICDPAGLRAITEDQTWVQEVGRPLGLDEETLSRHPMRHVLTMALGVSEAVDVRYYTVGVKPDTLLLLSSDGLHGVVAKGQLETILRENQPGSTTLEEKCYSLIHAAQQAGAPDNITVVLIRIS
jgi:serine/threonine protein phosphatase PrpC